jgi:ribosomal protein S28E/S33
VSSSKSAGVTQVVKQTTTHTDVYQVAVWESKDASKP